MAGDASRPRTPVLHLGQTCLTVVDRSATPVVHLEYTLPHEDTCEGMYGAPSHRFVALCRPLAPGEALPQWITRDDVEQAEAQEIPLFPAEAQDVLAEHPGWSGCWWPIGPIDEARPMTCDEARRGVDWDVTALPPGLYVVAAHTHQPPLNLWSPRWGAIAVHAGADPSEEDPVAFVANREAFVYADEVVALDVCTSAMEGATLELEYAVHGASPTWSQVAVAVPVEGQRVEVPWDPPAEVEGTDVRLRVTITDPRGRATTLDTPELLHVLAVPLPDPPPSDDPDPPPPDTCRDDPVPMSLACPTEPAAGTGELDEDVSDARSSEGCACSGAAPGPARGAWWPWLLPGLAVRRRGAAPAFTCK